MSEASSIRDRLERYYRETTDPEIQISDFTPISDGWETEVYSFTLMLRHKVEHLILRMYPGTNAAAKCELEYRGMSVLRDVGYPVPDVGLYETDSQWLSKPFLTMQKIDGRPLADVLQADVARQPELLTRFIRLLVHLHRIDYCLFADPCEAFDVDIVLPAMLMRWRKMTVADSRQAWVVPVFDWLETYKAKVLPSPGISLVHNDFHPNNILLTPDDKTYVIDWSGLAVNDYRVDLAWTLLLLSTMGYPELRPIILSEYERLSGDRVEQIEYFEVIAALRRLFDFAVSLTSGAESLGMRPETVAIMRQQRAHYEQVYALLQKHTGLRLPEIERQIDSLASP